MPPLGFEPEIPASEQQQTHALDRMSTGIGFQFPYFPYAATVFKN